MTKNDNMAEIIDVINNLCDDPSVPRNVKTKFQEILSCLNSKNEMSIKVNKTLHDLDEIGDDSNLQPYIRTQIWSLVSLLEKI